MNPCRKLLDRFQYAKITPTEDIVNGTDIGHLIICAQVD
jgi:hypothetical protein